jgi:hypothetical protein
VFIRRVHKDFQVVEESSYAGICISGDRCFPEWLTLFANMNYVGRKNLLGCSHGTRVVVGGRMVLQQSASKCESISMVRSFFGVQCVFQQA